MIRLPLVLLVVAIIVGGCSRRQQTEPRLYHLQGQVIEVVPDRHELTVKHGDIPGFMPAMTMAYGVTDAHLLDGLSRGDLIQATLTVRDSEPRLSAIERTGHAEVTETGPVPRVMNVLEPGQPVPDTVLQDQNGQPRRLTDWRGRAVAITFIYTRCPMPDFCPLIERQFAEAQQRIASDQALAGGVHLVAVSFDPQHDTPDVLKTHARARGADPRVWTYLTGTPKAIEDLASRFGVSVIREQDNAAAITHNLRTAVIDPRGRVVKMYSGSEWTAAMLVADLREARGRG